MKPQGRNGKTMLEIFDALAQKTNNCKEYKYIVLASLNLISPAVNKIRIETRFREAMTLFDQNQERASIPRLPNPDITAIIRRNKKIYSQIQKLINVCNPNPGRHRHLTQNVYGICDGLGIDLLFLFDQDAISKEMLQHDTSHTNVEPLAIIPLSKRTRELTKITAASDSLKYTTQRRRIVDLRFSNLLRADEELLREAYAAAGGGGDAAAAAAADGGDAAAAGRWWRCCCCCCSATTSSPTRSKFSLTAIYRGAGGGRKGCHMDRWSTNARTKKKKKPQKSMYST